MSEYQRYEFLAIDRRLSEDEMDELRTLSTRAHISPTRFFNEYHWGNFKGDPDEMMELYFDAYAYWANWGSRELQLRVPSLAIEASAIAPYLVEQGVECHQAGEFTIVRFRVDHEPEDGWFEDERLLYTLSALREDWMQGDWRALYIGWLACVAAGAVEDDAPEPPVPPGLGTLSPQLQALADFLDVWPGLLEVAAERSAPLEPVEATKPVMDTWLAQLPEGEKTALLLRLVADDDRTLRPELLRRFHQQAAPSRSAAQLPGRRAAELCEAAIRWEEAERERVEQEAILARQRKLDALAGREAEAWLEVEALIGEKKPTSYDQAIPLLKDLMDLAEREGRRTPAQARLKSMLARFTRRPALMDRLQAAGLL